MVANPSGLIARYIKRRSERSVKWVSRIVASKDASTILLWMQTRNTQRGINHASLETAMETPSDQQAQVEPVGELSHSLSNWPEREVAAGLHPQVLGIFIGTYGAMLLALWLLFGTDIN